MPTSLHDLLAPDVKTLFQSPSTTVEEYVTHLTTLSLSDLILTEPQQLQQASHTNLLSVQALAARNSKNAVSSISHLATVSETLPEASKSISLLRDAIPQLDEQAVRFSTAYSKSRDDTTLLDRRKNAMLSLRQVDTISDILDLPSLLATTIAAAGTNSNTGSNYSQALDLFTHVKRLHIIYPDSVVVKSVQLEAEKAMRDMTTNLITSLRGQNIRLAAAIRTIGFLRRVAPELDDGRHLSSTNPTIAPSTQEEGLFGSLFLTARLANLLSMLEALAPLRDLADQETARRLEQGYSDSRPSAATYTSQGQQTERYLKRYIEIFREQSFATISMYGNIFAPSENPSSTESQLPPALATFPLHIVDLLMETLQAYLPNMTDGQAREGLLVQVLYAASSLGRLGADFSMMLALLEDDKAMLKADKDTEHTHANGDSGTEEELSHSPEWSRVIEKHRMQAARLEALAAGQQRDAEQPRGSIEVAVKS